MAIWPFEGENKFNAREALHGVVTNAVMKSGRFNLVERDKLKDIINEMNIQKEDFARISSTLVDQGRILGANYCLFGNVTLIEVEHNTRKNTQTGETVHSYECKVNLDIRIVDIESGVLKISKTIKAGDGFMELNSDDTKEGAFGEASESILKETEEFIKKAFPQIVNLVAIESEKNGKATEVLISGGSHHGIKEKDVVEVYEVSTLKSGDEILEREVLIATLIVTDVQGQQISQCKVKSGGDKIKKKMDNGANIKCKSLSKRKGIKF